MSMMLCGFCAMIFLKDAMSMLPSSSPDATWAGAAKPYRFGLRHRFPKPIGLGA